MNWVSVTTMLPMEGEHIHAKLATGKTLKLIYDGDWVSPEYPTIRVVFINVTHWSPIGENDGPNRTSTK